MINTLVMVAGVVFLAVLFSAVLALIVAITLKTIDNLRIKRSRK